MKTTILQDVILSHFSTCLAGGWCLLLMGWENTVSATTASPTLSLTVASWCSHTTMVSCSDSVPCKGSPLKVSTYIQLTLTVNFLIMLIAQVHVTIEDVA